MTIKPVTFMLVLGAALLGGVVYLTQTQAPPPAESSSNSATDLFAFTEDQVKALTVVTPLRSLTFENSSDQPSPETWRMTQPENTPVNPATIAFLLNLLATGESDRVLKVPAANREDFGLDKPFATITVTLTDGTTHKLVLGDYDFSRSFIYAQADPPAASGDTPSDTMEVLLVSPQLENAISRPLEDWKPGSPNAESSPSETPSETPSQMPSDKPSDTSSETPSNSSEAGE
ncbi:MAG TPA: DUF4340 domain-containing protein [Chroococcidiopsis sp.]